jgi:predicted DNA-binding ribbon-helix-helix protein
MPIFLTLVVILVDITENACYSCTRAANYYAMKKSNSKIRTTLYIEEILWDKIRLMAKYENTSMSELVSRCLHKSLPQVPVAKEMTNIK